MTQMTRLPGVPDRADVRPGMAHYTGTGPLGSTCGTCRHRGYYRKGKDKFNERTQMIESKQVRTMGCREFLRLTHRHGPPVHKDWAACKFWEARNER